jgi:hypothetical protein
VKDLFEFYEKTKDEIAKNSHGFKSFVEEVCNEKSKEISSSIVSVLRKSSHDHKSNFDVKTSVLNSDKEKIILPKNNPLQEISINMK